MVGGCFFSHCSRQCVGKLFQLAAGWLLAGCWLAVAADVGGHADQPWLHISRALSLLWWCTAIPAFRADARAAAATPPAAGRGSARKLMTPNQITPTGERTATRRQPTRLALCGSAALCMRSCSPDTPVARGTLGSC